MTLTTATERILTAAVEAGLRPSQLVTRQGRLCGAMEIALNGEGTDGAYGALYVGAATGRVLRAVIYYGNADRRGTRYESVAAARRAIYALRDAKAPVAGPAAHLFGVRLAG